MAKENEQQSEKAGWLWDAVRTSKERGEKEMTADQREIKLRGQELYRRVPTTRIKPPKE